MNFIMNPHSAPSALDASCQTHKEREVHVQGHGNMHRDRAHGIKVKTPKIPFVFCFNEQKQTAIEGLDAYKSTKG